MNEKKGTSYENLKICVFMLLKSYMAGKGDSFLLQWDYEEKHHNALIDSGIPGTYRFIKDDLRKTPQLDFILVSHVDYDHLGGVFKLLDDQEIKLEGQYFFLLNTPSLILTAQSGDLVNLEHGIDLEKRLKEKGITVRSMYIMAEGEKDIFINGLQIKVFSPTKMILDALIERWTAHTLYQKHLEEFKSSDKVARSFSEKKSYEDILKIKEDIPMWENDLINASSIAILVINKGCSILFLGDANPKIVYEELKRRGYSENNKLNISLLKISHHGSKHNSTKDLFSILNCSHYLISTDGTGNNYHPDRETIVRLAAYGRESDKQRLNIYLNYDLDRTRFITPEEEMKWNLHFEHKSIFDFNEWPCYQKS